MRFSGRDFWGKHGKALENLKFRHVSEKRSFQNTNPKVSKVKIEQNRQENTKSPSRRWEAGWLGGRWILYKMHGVVQERWPHPGKKTKIAVKGIG